MGERVSISDGRAGRYGWENVEGLGRAEGWVNGGEGKRVHVKGRER